MLRDTETSVHHRARLRCGFFIPRQRPLAGGGCRRFTGLIHRRCPLGLDPRGLRMRRCRWHSVHDGVLLKSGIDWTKPGLCRMCAGARMRALCLQACGGVLAIAIISDPPLRQGFVRLPYPANFLSLCGPAHRRRGSSVLHLLSHTSQPRQFSVGVNSKSVQDQQAGPTAGLFDISEQTR